MGQRTTIQVKSTCGLEQAQIFKSRRWSMDHITCVSVLCLFIPRESKKTSYATLVHNFAKFWPDFQNPFTGGLSSKRVMKRSHHHTSDASHYLVSHSDWNSLKDHLWILLVFHSIYQFRDVVRPNLMVDNREFFTPHLYLRPNAPLPQWFFTAFGRLWKKIRMEYVV